MKRVAVAVMLGLTFAAGAARAKPVDDKHADDLVHEVRGDGFDGFCHTPATPLSFRNRALCPLAKEVQDCDALVKACDEDTFQVEVKEPTWSFPTLSAFLARLASAIVWVLVAAAVGLVLWLIVRAILKAQRDGRATDQGDERRRQIDVKPAAEILETATDAELLLRRADEHALRGELDRAATLYLAASLRALDRQGIIRIARYRTNGEYVRGCKDAAVKPELRAIVREVDRVQFGHEQPTGERVAEVAQRARSIVARGAAAALLAMAVFLGACGPAGPIERATDPGGDELFLEVLKREGMNASRLTGSIATLPMPKEGEQTALVVLDALRVPLESESEAHLERWVAAGGRLLIVGRAAAWPKSFGAKEHGAESTDVKFLHAVADNAIADDAPDDDRADEDDVTLARVASTEALIWPGAYVVATTGDHQKYAGVKAVEKGLVVGVAGDDLLTNAGISRPTNAAAIVGLVAAYAGDRKIAIAGPEDGITPPANPLSSLAQAGLGLALIHALAASIVLMLAYGIRQALPMVTPPPRRRAWTEHVEATGGLYARARLAPHALAVYARFVDGRLRARMPRGMTDPSAFLALRTNADPAFCADVWNRATAARSADRPRGDELGTLRDLSSLYAAAMKTE
jgi:hypothetical protein